MKMKLQKYRGTHTIIFWWLISLMICAVEAKNPGDEKEVKVLKKDVLRSIGGSAYLKRAFDYFLVEGQDTSGFHCTLSESKENGKVNIDINFQHSPSTLSYREKMEELKKILPVAAGDFNFDSLNNIHLGRLIAGGDLAISVSKEYLQQFGNKEKTESYSVVAQFLKNSTLGSDMNSLFNPLGLRVKSVSIEKLFFSKIKNHQEIGKLETDSTQLPEKILDCIVWVNLERM